MGTVMNGLLARLFPKTIDNRYRGQRLALWLFYPLIAVTLWRSQHHIFAADGGAQSIATIPLDTFGGDGAAAVISAFALWGLSQLLLGLVFLLVAIRYRALVPLCWLLVVLEYGGRVLIGMWKAMPTEETAPGAAAALPLAGIAVLMVALSLWPSKAGR